MTSDSPSDLSRTRIGITGHRFLAGVDRVTAGVDLALDTVARSFCGHQLVAVCSLAEGADQLAARRVLARPGSALLAALPLGDAEYRAGFQDAGSPQGFADLLAQASLVITLRSASHEQPLSMERSGPLAGMEHVADAPPAGCASVEDAYEAAGLYVLDHCDVLLAIWDGQPARGQGGTGWMVAEARRRGLPLAWVHAGNARAGSRESLSLGDEQGVVTLERFPKRNLGVDVRPVP